MCLQLAEGPPGGPKYDIHLTLHAGPRMQRDSTTKPRASLCYVTPPTYVTPPRPTCTSQLPSLAALGIYLFFSVLDYSNYQRRRFTLEVPVII